MKIKKRQGSLFPPSFFENIYLNYANNFFGFIGPLKREKLSPDQIEQGLTVKYDYFKLKTINLIHHR